MVKRFIVFASISIAALSCSNVDLTTSVEPMPIAQKSVSLNRSVQDALEIAIKSREDFLGTSTRSRDGKDIVDPGNVFVKTKLSTRSDNAIDSLYYVVNFPENSGFAVIAANKNEEALIAITIKGSFYGEPTGVYGFDLYMEETEKRLAESSKIAPQQGPDEMVTIICDTVSVVNEDMPPMINIAWHQREPFNLFCSKPFDMDITAGCPAIAVAQAMAYYQYPKELTLTYPGHDVDKVSLLWENMIGHSDPVYDDCEYCHMNGHLVREVGERLGTKYGNDSYIPDPVVIKNRIGSLGFTCDNYVLFESSSVVNSLKDGHPVILSGLSKHVNSDGSRDGHIWNVFGYRRFYQRLQYYTRVEGKRPVEMDAGYSITEQHYLYMNYGHGGFDDGYILSYHKQVDSGFKVYDGGTSEKLIVSVFEGDFNYDVRMLTNFRLIEQ